MHVVLTFIISQYLSHQPFLAFLGAFLPSLAGPLAGLHVAFTVLSINAATTKPRSLPADGGKAHE
jgi:hypothetical protein